MNANLTDYLLCLFAQQPRRSNALQYLLIGKRTSSNLFAGLQYGCLPLLQIAPKLDIKIFKNSVDQLVDQHYLCSHEKGYYQLTTLGQQRQQQLQEQLPQPIHYDGRWMRQLDLVKDVVLLAIQVVSQKYHHCNNYIPQINHLYSQWWIKQWLHHAEHHQNWQQQFITELTLLLTKLPTTQADFLANRFTGYQTLGLPLRQLALNLQQSLITTQVIEIDAWANFWKIVRQNSSQLPLMTQLLPMPQYFAANVMQTLQQFLSQRWSIIQISQHQHLRPSTIKEHLLEVAAIRPDLLANVHFGTQQQLAQLQAAWDDNHLKNYHALLDQGLSFFQIRFFHIQRLTL